MSKPWREYGRYGSVGIELVLSIMLGFYAGGWIDARLFGGKTWGGVIGLFLGMAVGFRQLFRTTRFMAGDIDRAERLARGEDIWAEPPPSPVEPPKDDSGVASSQGRDKTAPTDEPHS